MTLEITEGTVPATVSTRTREPNPFEGYFPTAEGKSLVVELLSGTEEEKKYVNKVKSQAQQAARESVSEDAPNGYTARVKADPCKIGKKEGTRLTIWTVDRIFRPRTGQASEQATGNGTAPESDSQDSE